MTGSCIKADLDFTRLLENIYQWQQQRSQPRSQAPSVNTNHPLPEALRL
jgi:hypothetical protein